MKVVKVREIVPEGGKIKLIIIMTAATLLHVHVYTSLASISRVSLVFVIVRVRVTGWVWA